MTAYPYLLRHEQAHGLLGTAIASREQLPLINLPVSATADPWRSIGTKIRGIEVFGFYFPLGPAKPPYWDWLLSNAEQLKNRDAMLLGDFNTGKYYLDETGASFECSDAILALEEIGFVDAWRSTYPKGRDYTWYSEYRNGFRLDYIWLSPSLASRLKRVRHCHEPRLTLYTDHSTVVAEID